MGIVKNHDPVSALTELCPYARKLQLFGEHMPADTLSLITHRLLTFVFTFSNRKTPGTILQQNIYCNLDYKKKYERCHRILIFANIEFLSYSYFSTGEPHTCFPLLLESLHINQAYYVTRA